MTRNSRPIFVEDSDVDSIPTDSTARSEQDEVYYVEKILAEDNDYEGTGMTAYLLQWEGYTLARATWEPPENIENDILIHQWQRQQRLIKAGKAKAFNVDEFDQAVERMHDEKAKRHRRRKIKRMKRGIAVSPISSEDDSAVEGAEPLKRRRAASISDEALDSGDEDVIEASKLPSKRRVKAPPVKRKGIAQKATGTTHITETSSDEDGEISDMNHGDQDSDLNSLFDAGSQPIYSDVATASKPAIKPSKAPGSKATPAVKPPTSVPKAMNAPKTPTSIPKPTNAATKPATAAPSAAKKSGGVGVTAAKSAATAKTAKRTPSIFSNWIDPTKKRKQRARVSGETPKDSTDPKFVNLALQNRFQKYSRNEPTPNLNLLTIVDPKTGQAQPAKVAAALTSAPAQARRGPDDIHSAYGRRTPPRTERQRSITPPTPELRGASSVDTVSEAQQLPNGVALPPDWRRTKTCWDWINGSCRRTAETCPFAHYSVDAGQLQRPPPPPPPLAAYVGKKGTTCHYWLHGRCRLPENECDFAHYDTGVLAKVTVAAPRSTTCYFWQNGGCERSEEDCLYAHRDTGVYASKPPSRVTNAPARVAVAPPRTFEPRDTTCYFWNNGGCERLDEECRFAHRDTGVYASKPGTYRKGSGGGGVLSSSAFTQSPSHITGANAQPVGGFPSSNTDDVDMQDVTMTVPSTAGEKGERSVRFQLPEVDSVPTEQTHDVEHGTVGVQIRVLSDAGGHFGEIDANLNMNGIKKFERLLYPVDNGVYLLPDRMATASDLQAFHPEVVAAGPLWPAGSILPRADSVAMASKLAEHCRLHAAGLISVQDQYTLLVYPSNSDEWRFMDVLDVPATPGTSLRFRMFPPVTSLDRSKSVDGSFEPALLQQPASVTVGNVLLGFDARKLLLRSSEQKVFVVWPSYRHDEMTVLVKYLQDSKCKVYHSGTAGAWKYFKEKLGKGSIIIINPEIPLWELPDLHGVLVNRDARIFSVAFGRSSDSHQVQQPTVSCERLLPHGNVIFITDDILAYHPEKATEIIQNFLKANAFKPIGGENDRIVARPGVKDWVHKLTQEHASDRGRPDLRWMHLYASICSLCPPDAEDPHDPPNPLPWSHLVSFPPEQLPGLVDLWERDEAKSTDMMVEWFAGWSALNADKFRRFFVCYEPRPDEMDIDSDGTWVSDPRRWSRKFQHIGVGRPDDLLKKFKPKK